MDGIIAIHVGQTGTPRNEDRARKRSGFTTWRKVAPIQSFYPARSFPFAQYVDDPPDYSQWPQEGDYEGYDNRENVEGSEVVVPQAVDGPAIFFLNFFLVVSTETTVVEELLALRGFNGTDGVVRG